MNRNLFAVLKIALGDKVSGKSMMSVKAKEKQMKKDVKSGNTDKYSFEELLQFIGYNPKYIQYIDEPVEIMQAIAVSQCPEAYKYILEPTSDVTEMYFRLKREKHENGIENIVILSNAILQLMTVIANATVIVSGAKSCKLPKQTKQKKPFIRAEIKLPQIKIGKTNK